MHIGGLRVGDRARLAELLVDTDTPLAFFLALYVTNWAGTSRVQI